MLAAALIWRGRKSKKKKKNPFIPPITFAGDAIKFSREISRKGAAEFFWEKDLCFVSPVGRFAFRLEFFSSSLD